jgi:hypothetical protein
MHGITIGSGSFISHGEIYESIPDGMQQAEAMPEVPGLEME